jgi:arginyl-tRNA synthetase
MVRGMSTRKGTVKFLDDILRDVGDKMHEVMKSKLVNGSTEVAGKNIMHTAFQSCLAP